MHCRYGDIVPVNNYELVYSCLIMMVGVIWYSAMLGTVVTIVDEWNSRTAYLKDQHSRLTNFCHDYEIQGGLQSRVFDDMEIYFQAHHRRYIELHTSN
jgi:hypothetical protein